MEIKSTSTYPASALSNFAPHAFRFRRIPVASTEGFLQGLKFSDPKEQKQVFSLVGIQAKRKGKSKDWRKDQTLYFQGAPIQREGQEYQDLLDEAFRALAENADFRKALLLTGTTPLTHRIGKDDPRETVLSRSEFCTRLMSLRERLPTSAHTPVAVTY